MNYLKLKIPTTRVCLSIACAVAIGIPSAAHAQRVVSLSADGTMRILDEPDCRGAECQWLDIDRNIRSISVAASATQIFQLHTTGAIWRWEGRPCFDGACPHWQQIDNNRQAVAIAANYDELFQLHRNGSIWRWAGGDCDSSGCPSWVRIDNNPRSRAIVAAGDQLFQLHDNGAIWRWKGGDCSGERCSSWEQLDNNPLAREITFSARGNLFQRHVNGAIWRWEGQPCTPSGCPSWTRIDNNQATVDILAAPGNLFQRHGTGAIWQWEGRSCEGESCPHWTRIGSIASLQNIVAGAQPYPDEFTGRGGGPAPVYAVHATGQVSKWPGEPCEGDCPAWIDMGQAFTRYQPTRGGLFVFDGTPPDQNNNIVVIPAQPGDADGDGLPDEWERDRADWGLSPNRADMIVVPVLRPEVAENSALMSTLQNNLAQAKNFYGNLPIRTERGAQGIHIVLRQGNRLGNRFRESADPFIDYGAVRTAGMPSELIGYAHGLLIGTGTSGGGQTSGPDWAGVSNNYFTIIHELGHQLGLEHTPGGATGQSPLYTSLMNYDYAFSFGGERDAVHFSLGKFADLRINERDLDENLPFPESDLRFLESNPYNFDVEARGPASATVDWNRNGIHGERGVRADVNDGYAMGVGQFNQVGEATGDVSMAALGNILVAFRTVVPGVDRTEYTGSGATPDEPGLLYYTSLRGREVMNRDLITPTRVVLGAPSATEIGGRILVAFPSAFNTIQLGTYTVDVDGTLQGVLQPYAVGGRREVTLAPIGTPNRAEMVLWDPATKQVETRSVTLGASVGIGDAQLVRRSDGTPFLSEVPPAAVYNSKTGKLVLLTAHDTSRTQNRLKFWFLDASSAGYRAASGRWLSDDRAASADRPALAFDDGAHAGEEGMYLAYFRTIADASRDDRHQIHVVRASPPATVGSETDAAFSNRYRMFINEWVASRNPPAVTPYQDDFAIVWRTPEVSNDVAARNVAEVNLFASGAMADVPADYNDISHIATRGLQRIVDLRP
ncbi:hypothetical protein IQ241_24915 [Romeria aff. gracilis LEGE 07310]|uniref:Uncharacterized protein n=1 Tax=Vasconcelosia minhoensis LEGE 07310 TaxID=915328 RepID=A0A8J7DF61_9CYAN|nr:hypothetical protein [Romeria gracilis]MBE9080483.1 hypothetical protein [Romeria aff. gracilis LEGE 07310]